MISSFDRTVLFSARDTCNQSKNTETFYLGIWATSQLGGSCWSLSKTVLRHLALHMVVNYRNGYARLLVVMPVIEWLIYDAEKYDTYSLNMTLGETRSDKAFGT